jgi:hypothetical protein
MPLFAGHWAGEKFFFIVGIIDKFWLQVVGKKHKFPCDDDFLIHIGLNKS